jgi:lantibiotic modifying enzyme
MEALYLLNKENMKNDIERALEIIINTPSSLDNVCCGTYGRIDVLLTASQKFCRPELQNKALEIASSVHSQTIMRSKNTNFDFFQGMSRIAYSMLRLSDPKSIPSVLSFEI